jgi:hypothetical protein
LFIDVEFLGGIFSKGESEGEAKAPKAAAPAGFAKVYIMDV